MASKQPNTRLNVDLNKGDVTKKELVPCSSGRKGKTSKRVNFVRTVRSLIRAVASFALYDKRITELVKVRKDKHALNVYKRKQDTHKNTKKKVQVLEEDKHLNYFV
ncbi:hypothetical protein R3W88_014674 [Solanum pinnatisectum]|uniref:60S ribosomal protein L36 n=1 Tax=Solanum pinnatisectum TaxID=50273 RepID=A0AAV9KSB8_9SOLN|nr:hypothetical protein R3W88_014674 [Solanum pinnatisectum]